MTGVQFVTDGKGRKVAVLIDLKKHGARLQDFWDGLISESRRREPGIPLEKVKADLAKRALRRHGKLAQALQRFVNLNNPQETMAEAAPQASRSFAWPSEPAPRAGPIRCALRELAFGPWLCRLCAQAARLQHFSLACLRFYHANPVPHAQRCAKP